jgi:hypothetical protein
MNTERHIGLKQSVKSGALAPLDALKRLHAKADLGQSLAIAKKSRTWKWLCNRTQK